jgi:sigma-B regulation protein RsbU (phosphoserine phosphatase)
MAAMVMGALRFPAYLRGRHLEQQLSLARRVQQGLLPGTPPSTAGLDVAASFEPAEQVGGDYYDVFASRHGDVALVLGDVSGKGLPAALVMGLVHGAVRTAAEAVGAANLSESVADLNGLLHARTSEERFVSLFWGYLNPSTRHFRYVNAGHLPPVVFRSRPGGGWDTIRLEAGGPVAGLLPGLVYGEGECELRPGDRLVLFSDGLVEATDARDVEFGEQGVSQVVHATPEGPAAALCDEIVRQARAFTGQRGFRDDLTVLVVRVTSSSAV